MPPQFETSFTNLQKGEWGVTTRNMEIRVEKKDFLKKGKGWAKGVLLREKGFFTLTRNFYKKVY